MHAIHMHCQETRSTPFPPSPWTTTGQKQRQTSTQTSSDGHLDGGGRGHRVEAALALSTDNAVVSLLAPGRAPRVLDDPVLLAGLCVGTIADNEDTVVKVLGVAEDRPGVSDTAKVELHGAGVDADRNGAILSDPGGELVLVGRERQVASDSGSDTGRLECAGVLGSLVGIVGLKVKTSNLLDLRVGILGETAVASLIDRVAVDQLLLRERDELARLALPLSLNVAGGRESPAAAALALVLDLGDRCIAPVNRVGHVRNGERLYNLRLARAVVAGSELVPRHLREVLPRKLLLGEIGKLGDAIDLSGLLKRVVGSNTGHILDEHSEAVGVLLSSLVCLVELLDELEESRGVVVHANDGLGGSAIAGEDGGGELGSLLLAEAEELSADSSSVARKASVGDASILVGEGGAVDRHRGGDERKERNDAEHHFQGYSFSGRKKNKQNYPHVLCVDT
eukprot:Opistho-2@68712